MASWPWTNYDIVINAAAFTEVDLAETPDGRREAWKINSEAVLSLASLCNKHRIILVQISTDYVFDGLKIGAYDESDQICPLGVYAQSKAAGDLAAKLTSRHYIVRTSWVVGEGNNFVRTIAGLADRGIKPNVVNDQIGRLSFTKDIASAIGHLLETNAPFGIYNVTNSGDPVSWFDIAQRVYELTGHQPADVTGVSTKSYYAGKRGIALRPLNSVLNLTKIRGTGFAIATWEQRLAEYLS